MVKVQGHRRPKLDLEAWRSYHSRALESSRQRHTMSDGNVAVEKKRTRVLHIVSTAPSSMADMRLADALVCI